MPGECNFYVLRRKYLTYKKRKGRQHIRQAAKVFQRRYNETLLSQKIDIEKTKECRI